MGKLTGKVAVVTGVLAEAQFDPDLAKSFKENWTLPRRKMVYDVLTEAIRLGEVRADIDVETAIDAFYGPIYYRLQMATGPISDAYVDQVFQQAMQGQRRTEGR